MGDNPPLALDSNQPLLPEIPPRPSYTQRIQRAYELSGHYASSKELLNFYARLAFSQQRIFEMLSSSGEQDVADSWPLVLDRVTPLFPDFARTLSEISPSPMRERAMRIAASKAIEQSALLARFWNGEFSYETEGDDALPDRFIALAFLQPYAEWLAQSGQGIGATSGHATCPVCGSEPVCAVLRDQVHGARRGLICSLCMNEWNFQRLVCPSCGEDRFEHLPIFTPEAFPHVRVDACDTCKHYIKTIDLTKDGLAVPVVDELATTSLDLWAREQSYVKLRLNLAGV